MYEKRYARRVLCTNYSYYINSLLSVAHGRRFALHTSLSPTATMSGVELKGARLALGISLLASIVWILHRVLNRVRVKSLIRNIPGPKSDSWLAGE